MKKLLVLLALLGVIGLANAQVGQWLPPAEGKHIIACRTLNSDYTKCLPPNKDQFSGRSDLLLTPSQFAKATGYNVIYRSWPILSNDGFVWAIAIEVSK